MSLLPENDREQEHADELQQNLELLESLPFFKELPSRVLKLLSFLCERGVYGEGDVVITTGEDSGLAAYVVSGEILANPSADENKETGGRIFREGEFFGGLSLLGSMPSLYTLQASKKTELLLLNRDQFQSILEQFPQVSTQLMQTVLRLLRKWEADRLTRNDPQTGAEYGITLL